MLDNFAFRVYNKTCKGADTMSQTPHWLDVLFFYEIYPQTNKF